MFRKEVNQKRIGIFIVYLLIFVSFFDNHSLLPIIALYARFLGAELALIGIIIGGYSVINLFGNLASGFLADRIGRVKPMVLGLIVVSLSVFGYSLSKNPAQLLAFRLAHGLGAAMIAPAPLAYLGDTSTPKKRGKVMAFYGACIATTVLIGPPIAGFLKESYGYVAVFYLISLMMLLMVLPVAFLVPESLKKRGVGILKFSSILKRKGILSSYTSAFSLMFSLGLLIVLLPLYSQDLGFSSAQTGFLFSSFALAAILVQIFPTNRISDLFGRKLPLIFGLFLIFLSLFSLKYFENLPELLIVMFFYGSGFGFLFPSMTALIADETELGERGRAYGIFTATYSLGVVVGSVSVGFIVKIPFLHPFQVASLVALLGILSVALLLRES